LTTGGGVACIVLNRVPEATREARAVALAIGKALHVPAPEVLPLFARLPITLPQRFDEGAARELVTALAPLGATCEIVRKSGPVTSCVLHTRLEASAQCSRCDAARCNLCVGAHEMLCARCRGKAERSRVFFRLRVTLLLGVLAIVVFWALRDVNRRKARTDWTKPLTVAVVVLRTGAVETAATERLRDRVHVLQERLAEEYRRYGGAPRAPFRLELYGPVDVASSPPKGPEGDGVIDLARYTFDLWRYVRGVNRRADLSPSTVDSSIYVVTRPPRAGRPTMVEGTSEEGGKIGIVEVDLDRDMVDFALFVTAHELLHTLGATDKYDAHGRAVVPDGIAEPERRPLYPQRFAEVMARNVPLGPMTERSPETLAELRVGALTAREIGWTK
jgi:hypothetical protein